MKYFIKLLLRAVFKLFFRVRVDGLFPANPPERLLIIANHESFLDGLLLGLFLPVEPVFVAHTAVVRHRWMGLAMRLVDHIAIDPTNPLAIRKVVKLLESGRAVCIFPEGRITTTGSLMKVYAGPAFAAEKTGAAILPVRIDGATRTYFSRVTGNGPKSLFPQLTLSVQPLVRIPELKAASAKAKRAEAGEHLRRIMQHMLFASQPQQTLPEALARAVAMYGRDRICVEDMSPAKLSYRELLRMSLAFSRLAPKTAPEGGTVGLLMPSTAPTLALMFGLQLAGRIPAMLNYTSGAEGMRAACHAAGVRQVVTSRKFIEKAGLAPVVDGMLASGEVGVQYLEDLRGELTLADKLWIVASTRFPKWALAQQPDSERPAAVLFTSGTEGKPKGVVLSHRALLANIAQIRAVIDVSPADKVLNVLPLFHSFGLTGGCLLPLLAGAEIVLYPTPLHYKVIPELVYDRNCTVLFGTSTFLGNYAKHAHPVDFYKLRYVIAGAERLNDTVRQAWVDKFGIRILEGYGATETAPVLAVNTPSAYKAGTVGQLLPGIRSRVLRVPGIDRGGMLHVNGPNLMSGYLRYDNPGVLERPSSEAGEGWYNTGDVVEIDDAGFVQILGRVKRFAKIAGEMISLEVVEQLANAAAPGGQHGATAIADEKRGETIVLFTTSMDLTREMMQGKSRELGLPELAVPRVLRQLAALPLLGTGKLDYVALKRFAETGSAQPG